MSTALRIVPPLPVTDSVLTATDVPEDSTAAWSAGTSYALAARAHRVSTHKVYESLVGSNLGNTPESSPAHWVEVGPTNRWALFDRSNSSQTAQANAFSYTLTPTASFNSFALLNITGGLSVRVRVDHASIGSLYDRTVDLTSLPAQAGWWEWFYGERRGPSLCVLHDLPGVLGAEVRVDVTGTSLLAVSVMLVGQSKSLGMLVQQGARLGIQDYSVKQRNDFGDTVLVERAYAKRASFELPILSPVVDEALSFLASIRALPCLFVGPRFEGAVIYGFYKEFDVSIAYATYSLCSLQVEGLT